MKKLLKNYLIYLLISSKIFRKCFTDKTGENILIKTNFIQYTFHYWLWKNYLDSIKTEWVGFCQYRKFFVKKKVDEKKLSFEDLNENILKTIEKNLDNFDCILGKSFSVENYKISKIIKNHFSVFIKNPSLFFFRKKRTLKLHFDLFHGKNNLDLE